MRGANITKRAPAARNRTAGLRVPFERAALTFVDATVAAHVMHGGKRYLGRRPEFGTCADVALTFRQAGRGVAQARRRARRS
jgi:hypothetical protein